MAKAKTTTKAAPAKPKAARVAKSPAKKASTPPAVATLANFAMLAVASLRPSPTNPRKRFDAVKLGELAESIREQGVLEPILVRPISTGHEIVAGERRWRAAQLAELAEVPCLVRDLSDDAVLEVQVAENIQREDMTALEEADAFAALAARGRTPAEIADRIGRKTRYVEQRLAVARAHESVRALLEADVIGLGSALLIVAFDLDAQARIATSLDGRRRLSVNDVLEELSDWNRVLRGASFDVEDATLLAGVGGCSACPKNSASQLTLLGEVDRNATCLDAACWERKCDAAWARAKADADERGLEVVETEKTYGFTKVDDRAWEIVDRSTGGDEDLDEEDDELDGDEDEDLDDRASEPAPRAASSWAALAPDARRVLVRDPRTGRVFEALAPGEKERILEAHGVSKSGSAASGRDPKDIALEARTKAAVRAEAMAAVVAHYERDDITDEIVWPLLAKATIQSSDACMRICKRRGLVIEREGGRVGWVEAVRELIETVSWAEVRALVLEHELDARAQSWSEEYGAPWEEAKEAAGFDEEATFEAALAAARENAAAKAAKKASKRGAGRIVEGGRGLEQSGGVEP